MRKDKIVVFMSVKINSQGKGLSGSKAVLLRVMVLNFK